MNGIIEITKIYFYKYSAILNGLTPMLVKKARSWPNEIFEIGFFILLSGIKYLFAVIPLLYKSNRPWYFDMLIVGSGGILGVYVFTYLGVFISNYFEKFHLFRFKYAKLKRFVRIKNSYGLIGIAALSPVLFSIPVGCIISASFEHDKKKIIRYQLVSVIVWSILLFGVKGLFNINLTKMLNEPR